MNILIIITKGNIGGATKSVFSLAREFSRRGHTVTVGIGAYGDALPRALEKEGIAWIRLHTLVRGHNPFMLLRFVGEIRRVLSEGKYDVLHINTSNALPAAFSARLLPKSRRPKTVFTFRGMSLLDTHYELPFFVRYIYILFFNIFLLFVDVPVFISKENMERGKALGMAKGSRLIYNGLAHTDTDFMPREKARAALAGVVGVPLPDDIYLIGSVGRLAYQKHYDFLVRAFARHRKTHEHARLLIIGDGEERALVEKEIHAHGMEDAVYLVGALSEAFRFMRGFDLLVLTSRYEGLSITLIEALMAGLPIVASDVGGNAETILPEGLYTQGDEDDFLAAIERVRALPKEEQIARTQTQADHFRIARTVDEYEEAYRETR
jgi:glycosyltransferase involved in cell wall biosynthesis